MITARSETNRFILKDFYEYMRSKDHKSDRNVINLLDLLISFDKFYGLPFTSINSKEQILTFLNHRYVDGKWVELEHDEEGRYITSWNFYLGLLRTFFRWLSNRSMPDDERETPAFLKKIKTKKPLRDSPYELNDVWELDDMLTIIPYEPELCSRVIITLLWDANGRPHEIAAIKLKHVKLSEQYGEAVIPSNTKTGGGAILLTTSFPYVHHWVNDHPLKEPDARLICSLVNGKPVTPQAIWEVLTQLQLRIKRLVESGSITDDQRQKLEYLLGLKNGIPTVSDILLFLMMPIIYRTMLLRRRSVGQWIRNRVSGILSTRWMMDSKIRYLNSMG